MRQEATQHYFGNWEYVENPFETPRRPQEPSYEQQEDFNQPVDKPPGNERLDAQKERFSDTPVFAVEMSRDRSTYVVRGAAGEYRDSRVGDNRVDRPSDNFQGVKFTQIDNIYVAPPPGGRFWTHFKPLATKMVKGKLEYELNPQDWWRLSNTFDRKDHYIYGGVKDKGHLTTRPYHIDTAQYTVEQLNKSMNISKKVENSMTLQQTGANTKLRLVDF